MNLDSTQKKYALERLDNIKRSKSIALAKKYAKKSYRKLSTEVTLLKANLVLGDNEALRSIRNLELKEF